MLLVLLDWVMVIPRDVLLRHPTGNHEDELHTTYLSLIMRVSILLSRYSLSLFAEHLN